MSRRGSLSAERQGGEIFLRNRSLYDHRKDHPWLIGALGDPDSGVWFVGENPSLRHVERARHRSGGPPTENDQWSASRGDKLFRDLLVKHGFKRGSSEAPGGWQCYITNVIKETDYVATWRRAPAERRLQAIDMWAPVFRWQLESAKPHLVVALGKTVRAGIHHLAAQGIKFPRVESVQHYSYVAFRPEGKLRPMHPRRVAEYDREFARIAKLHREMRERRGRD
ncbi:MAG: uracil-DNA glycosylase family protein [Deferrisomatales bacterium]